MKTNEVFHNRYELLQRVGSGGFSEVWKSLDKRSGITVAVKIFRKQDQEGIELCREEYLKTFELRHPNILAPYHFDVSDDRPYLVMKFMTGGTLAVHFGKLENNQTQKLIAQLSSALQYIHTLPEPIIHGDLKPDNILIDDQGNYYLTDFGISTKLKNKFTQTIAAYPTAASNKGITPMAYRSPETFRYKNWNVQNVSPKSDIWSSGVMLYQILYNTLPFNGEGGLGQLILMLSGDHSLDEILEFDNNTPQEFQGIIMSALQLYPEHRSTILVQADLRQTASGIIVGVGEQPGELAKLNYPGENQKQPPQEESKYLVYLALLVFILIATVFGYTFINNTKTEAVIVSHEIKENTLEEVQNPEIEPDRDDRILNNEADNSNADISVNSATNKTVTTSKSESNKKQRESAPSQSLSSSPSVTTSDEHPDNSRVQSGVDKNMAIPSQKNSDKEQESLAALKEEAKPESSNNTASKTAIIRPNIPIPLMLNEDITDVQGIKPGDKIAFVVETNVDSYGDVFLKKGQIVHALVKKVGKNKINIRFPELYSSGGTKLKSPNLDNFEILAGKDKKGKIYKPVTSGYQQSVLIQ